MRAELRHKGQTVKVIAVSGIAADRPVSDDLILGFAMATVGENPSSLFGWNVKRFEGETNSTATVELYTG
jgi:hypothetical protein